MNGDDNTNELKNETTEGVDKKDKKEKESPAPMVPFLALFRYADSIDYVLMFLGILFAAVQGAAMPVVNIIFGRIIDAAALNPGEVNLANSS